MNAQPPRGKPPLFEEGGTVTTPSGAVAKVLRIFVDVREVEVEWPTGQTARFKFAWLTPTRATG